MSTIQVQAPGLLTTVQDLGREGHGALGVSASGAADPIALRIGNRLLANPENASALEMTLLGGTFVFPDGAAIALTGSDFGANVNGVPLPLYESLEMKPGQSLRVGPTVSGARCYLCVGGGIDVEPFFESASTHLLSGLGGHQGRALRKGDMLKTGSAKSQAKGGFRKRTIRRTALEALLPRLTLRVTSGPQAQEFSEAAWQTFCGSAYRVTEETNRMGIRLQGAAVARDSEQELVTEGVSLGAVQIPPSGQPIVLFVEQQTTGGYPKIANAISADLASLGQLRPRDEIRFERVEIKRAIELLREQEAVLASSELIQE